MKQFLARVTITVAVLTTLFVGLPANQIASAACAALPTDKGTATMTVNIPATGTYRVWSRVMAPDTTNNSFYLQVDQTYCQISVGGGTSIPASTWTWVDYQNGSSTSKVSMDLTSGSHTVVMAGQEADVMVDRLIFTTDTACVPTGTGDNCATAPATIDLAGVTANQTVSGNVTVSATVANAPSVSKVEFFVDNTLYSTDTSTPYCMVQTATTACGTLNTATLANGNHTIKATATYSGGTINSTVTVNVQNSAPVVKQGDINHDGSVNIFDLSILLSKWATNDTNSDLNANGTVDVFDLSILLSKWGT